MKNTVFFSLFFLMSLTSFSQFKGVVKDSIDGKPIPYVNIAVANENIGTTSEENGEFTIYVSDKSKKLVFSSLGFETKTVAVSEASEVRLKPAALELDEIVIVKRFETRQKEIGKPGNLILETFDQTPRMDIKFFPYLPSYDKTRFLKQVGIVTDSKIDDATFKIHLYSVDANGLPGKELLEKDFIVSVDKGVSKTKFDLKKFNLRMPKNGIFIGFEKLLITKNKIEKTITNPNTKTQQTFTTFYPFLLYNNVKRDLQFVFSGGKWVAKTNSDPDNPLNKVGAYEPALTLILSN